MTKEPDKSPKKTTEQLSKDSGDLSASSGDRSKILRALLEDAGVDPSDPQVSRALEVTFTSISGTLPIPPAILLEQWEQLYPGITEKFIEWTEAQSSHRRELEKERQIRSENRQDRSQWIGGVIAVVALYLASETENGWVGAIMAIVGVGGPAAALALAYAMRERRQPKTNQHSDADSEPPR